MKSILCINKNSKKSYNINKLLLLSICCHKRLLQIKMKKLQNNTIELLYGKWIKIYETKVYKNNEITKYPDIIYNNYNDLREFYNFKDCIIISKKIYIIYIFEKKDRINLIQYKFIPSLFI